MKVLLTILAAFLLFSTSLVMPVRAFSSIETITFVDDFDTCTGETISMTGTQQLVNRVTVDSAGVAHYGFHRTTHAVGFSSVDGSKYTLHDVVNRTDVEFTPGQPRRLTEFYVSTLRLQGNNTSLDDSYIYMRSTTEWDAAGNIVSAVEIERVACR